MYFPCGSYFLPNVIGEYTRWNCTQPRQYQRAVLAHNRMCVQHKQPQRDTMRHAVSMPSSSNHQLQTYAALHALPATQHMHGRRAWWKNAEADSQSL